MSYGIPKTLLSDNGTNLRSREFEELLTKYQVHHLYTSIETPSTNGQNEGYNRILITALRARQSVHDWDQAAGPLTYAYNCTYNYSTQFEPYFLAFGTHPRQVYHNALDLAPNWTRCDNRDDMLIELTVARIQAQENQYKNQLKNKAQVDKKRVDSTFQPGDLVLLKEPTWRRRRNGKLKNIFTGPHVVTAILSLVLVRIATKGDDDLVMNVRADRLKTYHVRPTTYSSPSERT